MPVNFDVVVVGGGAAGLMCAAVAAQGGVRVAVVDHSETVAEKIRISGGGRCNFTNRHVGIEHMVGENPRFARYALTEYPSSRFIALVRAHRIPFHEKHKGQLFCDESAQDIIELLLAECAKGQVTHIRPATAENVAPLPHGGWHMQIQGLGEVCTRRLVVATGGLSIPKIGASDWGYRLARQLDIPVVETRPALVPLMFDPLQWQPFAALSGLAMPVRARAVGEKAAPTFDEDLLFTHRGLSGPAVLQISSFWQPGQDIQIDLGCGQDWGQGLLAGKAGSRQLLRNVLLPDMPRRLWDTWLDQPAFAQRAAQRHADLPDRSLREVADSLRQWTLRPMGSEGYRKAEVTRGGVSTRALNPVSLECKAWPGLHFIGEVVDITGWLGGYNFQWAWASGYVAGCAALQ